MYYGFTIKANTPKLQTDEELCEAIGKVTTYTDSEIHGVSFEYDSREIIHAHGILVRKDKIDDVKETVNSLLDNRGLRGFHIYIREIFDISGWIEYISKSNSYIDASKTWDVFNSTENSEESGGEDLNLTNTKAKRTARRRTLTLGECDASPVRPRPVSRAQDGDSSDEDPMVTEDDIISE